VTPYNVVPTKIHSVTSHKSIIFKINASRIFDSVSVTRQGVEKVNPQIVYSCPAASEQEAIRLQRVLNIEGHIQPGNR
jgi:hypothetical protein